MITTKIINNVGILIDTFERVYNNRGKIVFTYILVTNGKRYSAKEFLYYKPDKDEIKQTIDYLIQTLTP